MSCNNYRSCRVLLSQIQSCWYNFTFNIRIYSHKSFVNCASAASWIINMESINVGYPIFYIWTASKCNNNVSSLSIVTCESLSSMRSILENVNRFHLREVGAITSTVPVLYIIECTIRRFFVMEAKKSSTLIIWVSTNCKQDQS